MPIDFPSSPALNDTYTYNNRVWKWNGTYWQANGFGTLAATSGGTGQTSYAVGDILYASTTTALSKLSAGTSGQILKTNGSGAAPSWDNLQVPVGALQLYAGSSTPTGWLLCDGTAYSRATYASLFALISTTYGTGDGSSTFNVPDFRGRSPIGVGTGSGLTARALAATVGVETHPLVLAELPSHNHTATDSGHTHTGTTGNQSVGHTHIVINSGGGQIGRAAQGFSAIGGGYQGLLIIRGSDTGSYVTSFGVGTNHTHTITAPSASSNVSTTSSNGSGTAHNNMQPSLVLNYIIKT
jgi:microcystin-dependent protein